MIYYYLVKVKFSKGNTGIIKEYRKNFLEIGKLFQFLEERHKNNYTLIYIKPLKYVNGYQRMARI